jgi:ABC-type sugar transport system substrate-binding protein
MKRFFWLLTVLLAGVSGCASRPAAKLGFMPKLTPIPYFQACRRGAEEAARELGIELIYDGPTEADVNQQIDMLNQWIDSGEYWGIAVACNDPDRIGHVLRRAQDKGLVVITYDADANEGRSYFVNQATYESVAEAMVDSMAGQLSPRGEGKVGILTSSIQAPNQSQWARRMKAYARTKYPRLHFLPEVEHGEDRDPGIAKAKALIQAHKDLKGIIGLTSVAVPAAAEAVRQKRKKGVIRVTGVSTPKDMRDYIEDGTVKEFILWNPVDLGYLAVHVADRVRKKRMPTGGTLKKAGRLADIRVRGGEVILGKPLRFTEDNIDKYDF